MGFLTDLGEFSGSSGGGFLGALEGNEKIYGRKPNPVPVPTASDILGTTLDANIANQGKMGQFQAGQQDQLLAMLERAAPGSTAAQGDYLNNIRAGLRGQVPTDVLSQIQRGGAAWALNSGTGPFTGDSLAANRSLRNLGLTSLQRQDLAGQQLEGLLANMRRTEVAPFYAPITAQVDPYAKYKADLMNEQIAAAPDPVAAGAAAAQQALIESVLSVYGGQGHSNSIMQSGRGYGGYGGGGSLPSYGAAPYSGNDYGNELNVGYGGGGSAYDGSFGF